MKLLKFDEMAGDIQPIYVSIDNIGDLKKVIKDLPDDMWVGLTTSGDGFSASHAYIGTVGDYPDKVSLIFVCEKKSYKNGKD